MIFSLTLFLQLALSYPVDTNTGKAKFDKTTKCLTITLPIVPPSHPPSLPPSLPPPLPPSLPTQPLSPPSHVKDELTNQNTESCESCDQVDDESTNQIASAAEQNDSDNLTNHSAVTDMTSSNDSITASNHVTWTSKGVWSTPLFTYRQDNERVVYVLHSKGIKSSTIVHHSDEHQVM